MPLCGSSSCGCAVVSVPATSGAINGALPAIDVAGNGAPTSPWNLTLNDEWAAALAAGYPFGPIVCTSSTRPATPTEGMSIYETDTDLRYEYDGSSWVPSPGQLVYHGSGSQASVASTKSVLTIDTEIRDAGSIGAVGSGVLTAPRTGLYSLQIAHSATGSPSNVHDLRGEVTTGDPMTTPTSLAVSGNNSGTLVQGAGPVQLDVGDQLTLYLNSASTASVATYSFVIRLFLVAA
jgi:hypothetical protein